MATDCHESPYRFLTSVIKELKCLALANMEYFQNGNNSHHAKFHTSFCLLYEYLDLGIEPGIATIFPQLSEFDASPEVKGNGYRSLLQVIYKCCSHLVQLLRHITINRDSMLFRRANYCKEVEAYVATLGQLRACLYYAQKLMTYCSCGNLFADEDNINNSIAEQLMCDVETLNEDCFYGRCLGFQFCYSMQKPLNVVAIAMASFSEGYQENTQIMKLATSIISSGKYLFNPELRAQQVVNVTRSADVNFCKAFWGITETEIMKQLPSFVCPSVQVDEVLHLGPDSFDMLTDDGSSTVVITPPCAHTGPGSVQVRLISYVLREGQDVHHSINKRQAGRMKVDLSPMTPGLVVHCHGGGFVAQSSKSHEVYLRHWAKELNVPILSIDYSLAPECPFPRALEECFYAYAWAVENVHKLGSTGERICLAGDSAGGNLMISTAFRAASIGIRIPDGIMAAYTPVMVRYTPSPSRLLTLMDPLLPVGILSRCLAAYAGVSDKLATGLASTVFPGEDDGAVNLQADESSDEWIIVSKEEESLAKKRNVTDKSQQTSPSDTQVKVRLDSQTSPDNTQVKVRLDSQTSPDDTQIKVRLDSQTSPDDTQVKVPIVLQENCDELQETDSGVTEECDEPVSEYNVSELDSTNSMASLDVHPPTIDTASNLEETLDVDKISPVSSCSSPSENSPVLTDPRLPKTGGQDLHEEFSVISLNDTPMENNFSLIKEYEIVNSECVPVCNSIESKSSSGSDISFPDEDDQRPIAELQNCFVISCDGDNKTKNVGKTGDILCDSNTSSKHAEKVHKKNSGLCAGDEGITSPACCNSTKKIPPANRESLELKLAAGDTASTFSPPRLLRSPSTPVFNHTSQKGSPTVMGPSDFVRHRHHGQSPLQAMRHLPIVRNPYMSPLLAPSHMLKTLPHICLVACHLDPILDDSVMFAKKLNKLGKSVDLHLIDDLPHGFLNFALVSKEAKQASDVCVSKIRGVLNME